MELNAYKKIIDMLVGQGHGNKEVVFGNDEGSEFKTVVFKPCVMKIETNGSSDIDPKTEVVCIN
jgi:hypothetical protein